MKLLLFILCFFTSGANAQSQCEAMTKSSGYTTQCSKSANATCSVDGVNLCGIHCMVEGGTSTPKNSGSKSKCNGKKANGDSCKTSVAYGGTSKCQSKIKCWRHCNQK